MCRQTGTRDKRRQTHRCLQLAQHLHQQPIQQNVAATPAARRIPLEGNTRPPIIALHSCSQAISNCRSGYRADSMCKNTTTHPFEIHLVVAIAHCGYPPFTS